MRNVDGVFLNPGPGVFPSSVDIYSTPKGGAKAGTSLMMM